MQSSDLAVGRTSSDRKSSHVAMERGYHLPIWKTERERTGNQVPVSLLPSSFQTTINNRILGFFPPPPPFYFSLTQKYLKTQVNLYFISVSDLNFLMEESYDNLPSSHLLGSVPVIINSMLLILQFFRGFFFFLI